MRRFDEPLTVTSLQILCGNDSEVRHNPKNETPPLVLYAQVCQKGNTTRSR